MRFRNRASANGNPGRKRRAFRKLGFAFGLAYLATTVAPGATSNDLCGTTIVEDLTLDHDLACIGDGLVIGANGIEVDLNHHTIAGPGTGVGILVSGRSDVEIFGGTIANFAAAISTNASTGVEITRIEFVGNRDGIDLQAGSVANTVMGNVFRNSVTRAIMLRGGSTDNDIKYNAFTGNRTGILVNGSVDNTIKINLISESTLAGIRLNGMATGNVVKDNVIVSSHAPDGQMDPAAGIEFMVTPTGSSTGNHLLGNWLVKNDCGLKGPTAGNTLAHNVFRWNVTDTCS